LRFIKLLHGISIFGRNRAISGRALPPELQAPCQFSANAKKALINLYLTRAYAPDQAPEGSPCGAGLRHIYAHKLTKT
jgi:hypothetical protein